LSDIGLPPRIRRRDRRTVFLDVFESFALYISKTKESKVDKITPASRESH